MKLIIEIIGTIKDIIRESPIEIEVTNDSYTIADLLEELFSEYSGLREKMLMSNGELQRNMHIYLRDDQIEKMETKIADYKNKNNEVAVTIFALQAFTGGF